MKYFFLIYLYTTVVLSEIVQRTYRKDGVKEFQIVKYIKGNKCDCSCQCNPQNQLKIFTETTTSLPITTVLLKEDDETKNVENINLGNILSTNGKKIKLKTVDVSAETNIVTNEDIQPTTINPTVSSLDESSSSGNLNNFEETPPAVTTVGNIQFHEKLTSIKVNEEESALKKDVETTSSPKNDDVNILTTTIIPVITDQLSTAIDEETTTTPADIETTNNFIAITNSKENQIKEEKLETTEHPSISVVSTNDNTESTATEINLPTESIVGTTILSPSLSTEESQITETLETLNFEPTTQKLNLESTPQTINFEPTTQKLNLESTSQTLNFETTSQTTIFETENKTNLDETTTSTRIKDIAENESVDTFSEGTTISTQKNILINDKSTVKEVNDFSTTTQKTIKNNNNSKITLEKENVVNELGLKISDSNDTSLEEDIPEAEFSDSEKNEHISSNITNPTTISIDDITTTKTIELETTTLSFTNTDISLNLNNIATSTIQTTTETESGDVAFKIEEIDDKSEEEATEIVDSTILTTTPSIIAESVTKQTEIFNVSDVIQKIDIVTEKVDELDNLDSQLTKEIYNIVSEIRSKFENTSTSFKIDENDQRLIQVKWSKLINKLREKLAILKSKKVENDETLGTVDFVTSQTTTPSITIFSKKYKEPIKTDFSINENPSEEKVPETIDTLENRLEKAKLLREKEEKAEFDEKLSIEKTLDALAEKERLLREQADRKRLHFSPNQLNKAKTISDTTLIRQPIRRIPDHEEIDDSIKLPQIQCEPVRNFIKIFKISDPKVWIQENCQFVKQYFPSASCVQIKDILISCL
uniref:ShKT domain-containing protein n=1 Tax=Strongyloides papillosus TaxID=174720 RepID=A0A0N5B634_STREA